MTESPVRLGEIAALSWTAARTRHGHTEEKKKALQQAVDITRRWLAEVESEILSYIELSGAHSERICAASSEGGTCLHVEDAEDDGSRKCCLSGYLEAYRAVRPTSTDPQELKLLCQMHVGFNARVTEAEAQIGRLSTLGRGRIRRRESPHLNGSTFFGKSSEGPQQLAFLERSKTPDGDVNSGSQQESHSSRYSTEVRRKHPIQSSQPDSATGGSTHAPVEDSQAARKEEPVPGGSRNSSMELSQKIVNSSAKASRFSNNSIHSGDSTETGSDCQKGKTFRESAIKARSDSNGSFPAASKGITPAISLPQRRSDPTKPASRRPRQSTPQETENVCRKILSKPRSIGSGEKVEHWLGTLPSTEGTGHQA